MTTTTSATSSAASTATTAAATTTTSKSSLGQSVLTSLNAGSGVDTASLITNLTAAQKSSLEDPITTAQATNTAQISAAASLASDITQFSSALDSLIAGGTLMTQPNSTDTSVMSVSAVSGAKIGDLSATVTVSQLAQSQTIESQAFSSSLSAGSFVLHVNGGAGTTISYADGASISDIAKAVNAAKTGVTATVATDSSGAQRLVLKGATGAASAFTIDGATEASFNYTPPTDASGNALTSSTASGSGMGLDQVAQDAMLKVDGVSYSRATNTFSDVITGVKMSITKTGTTSLSSTRPTDSIVQAVNDFVSAYNTVKADIESATAAATDSATAGALRGNSTIRDMQARLTKLTTTPLIASGSITTLAQLGVKTARDGTLSVDTTTLNKMIAAYPDDVEAMFNPQQTSSNAAVSITSKTGVLAAGVYSLTGATNANGASTGTVNGVAVSGVGANLTGPAGTAVAGLTLTLQGGATNVSSTLTIDLGLGGALAMIKAALTDTKTGTITALQSRLTDQSKSLADQLTAADKKVTSYHDRLVTQFSAMDTRVSAYKATQSYLTQQVDLWTKSSS